MDSCFDVHLSRVKIEKRIAWFCSQLDKLRDSSAWFLCFIRLASTCRGIEELDWCCWLCACKSFSVSWQRPLSTNQFTSSSVFALAPFHSNARATTSCLTAMRVSWTPNTRHQNSWCDHQWILGYYHYHQVLSSLLRVAWATRRLLVYGATKNIGTPVVSFHADFLTLADSILKSIIIW